MAVKAAPIRSDPLEFGEKIAIRKQKPAAVPVDPESEPEDTATEQLLKAEQVELDTSEPQSQNVAQDTKADTVEPGISNEGGTAGEHGSSGLDTESMRAPEAHDSVGE